MVLKDTEKVAAGALRQALQTWLAPQLSTISEPLARLEGEISGVRGEMSGLKAEVAALRSEMQAGFRSVDDRIDVLKERATQANQRIDEARDIRERLVALEAKIAAR